MVLQTTQQSGQERYSSSVSVSSPDSISRSGRSTGQGIGYPLQYSGLENSMDYTVHGVVKSWM